MLVKRGTALFTTSYLNGGSIIVFSTSSSECINVVITLREVSFPATVVTVLVKECLTFWLWWSFIRWATIAENFEG